MKREKTAGVYPSCIPAIYSYDYSRRAPTKNIKEALEELKEEKKVATGYVTTQTAPTSPNKIKIRISVIPRVPLRRWRW